METWQIFVGFMIFFIMGLAFSYGVFMQYRKENRKMLDRVDFLEKNMIKALSKLEGWENETT